jgi:LemA protein
MDLNTNANNQNVNNPNPNPMNAALGGNAGKGCFGLGKMGCIGIAVLAALAMWVYSGYNGLVTQEEEVKTAWSQVENQYQRRIDLIKNVAASAKKYAKHEQGTFQGVTNARARTNVGGQAEQADQQMQAVAATADSLANVKMDPNNAQSMQAYAAAQDKMLEQARLAINVVHEAYPELKADKLFENLQVQLEGTENRVATERKKFNETAQAYNTNIRKFPGNILAKFFGFNERPYFAAQAGADKAPDLDTMFDE